MNHTGERHGHRQQISTLLEALRGHHTTIRALSQLGGLGGPLPLVAGANEATASCRSGLPRMSALVGLAAIEAWLAAGGAAFALHLMQEIDSCSVPGDA